MLQAVKAGIRVFAIGALLCAFGVSRAAAQSANGTLTGTVLDQAGKAIQNASVDVRNETTGASRSINTDNEGKFSAADLPAGSYSVIVSVPGFALTTRSGGQVAAGATLDVPISLSVETVATAITVNETISLAAAAAPS